MTSDLRTAAQQALEALESADWYINQLEQIVYSDDDTDTHEERAKVQAAITALRAALAEPNAEYERGVIDGMQRQAQSSVDRAVNRMAALAEPVQEPVRCPLCNYQYGHQIGCENNPVDIALSVAPPQRKPLTDEEIRHLKPVCADLVDFRSGVRRAEWAHGIT